jgi:hypothetical protein
MECSEGGAVQSDGRFLRERCLDERKGAFDLGAGEIDVACDARGIVQLDVCFYSCPGSSKRVLVVGEERASACLFDGLVS